MCTMQSLDMPDTCDDRKPECSHENGSALIRVRPAPLTRIRQHRTGAPDRNVNRATHGLRIKRASLYCLPSCWRQAGRTAAELRRALEDDVEQVYGEVSTLHALAINTAAKWERHGSLAARWLRENP